MTGGGRGAKRRVKRGLRILRGAMGAPKIFCLSLQRTGTTSVGVFFARQGKKVAPYRVSRQNGWTRSWFAGDYESIFRSLDFLESEVFEDDPWWCGDFYKVLYHRFPSARFVLLERDPDRWFNSMMSHSDGNTLGNTYRHATLYRRERDLHTNAISTRNAYTAEIDNLLPLTEEHRQHYTDFYVVRNRAVREFFEAHDRSRLFTGALEAPDVWHQLGLAFHIEVPPDHLVHAHKSVDTKATS